MHFLNMHNPVIYKLQAQTFELILNALAKYLRCASGVSEARGELKGIPSNNVGLRT